jgi:hypothetical protein
MDYIDVFNEGRDVPHPILTLYDEKSVRLFFDLLCASGNLYKRYFRNGKIALVSFTIEQDMQTGTGLYAIEGGYVKVQHETGALKGILQRIHYDKGVQAERREPPGSKQRKEGSEDDTARERRYQEYLQQQLQQAAASGDQRKAAEVILHYHQAILEVAQAIELTGEDQGKIDLDAFRAKARGLERQRAWFARIPERFDEAAMKALVAAVTGALQDIEQLSAEAQAQIQRAIVTRFYDIRHPPSGREGQAETP